MKTIEELKKQEPIFLNNWGSKTDLIKDFEELYYANEEEIQKATRKYNDINILFASYGTEMYMGEAFVLFEKNKQLFEVNADHCSCYGLEGQFQPEETTIEAIKHRLTKGRMGTDEYTGNIYAKELMQFLGIEDE